MDIDWQRLIDVRRRHRTVAQDHVARERDAVGQCEARHADARGALQQRIEAQARLWTDTAATGAALSVCDLRGAAAWSRALDGDIAEAACAAQHTERQLADRQRDLEAARARLRAAASDLRRAEDMESRARADQRRAVELRCDEAADDAATERWMRPA